MVEDIGEEIRRYVLEKGADLVGFTPADRWDEKNEVPKAFRPRSLWAETRTVIVAAMSLPLPVVETTPSTLHMELYRLVNRKLDDLAYNVTRFLNRKGYASTFFVRDGYTSIKALKEKPMAAFGHVRAALYAGLGTVGMSGCLLTPAFGPRVRFVSVFTSLELPGDPLIVKDLCIQCEACAKCCPKSAITPRKDGVAGDYDKMACLAMAEELTRRRCYPCGICIKVCPVGEDRVIYRGKGIMRKYLRERDVLARNPDHPHYASWQHIRAFGAGTVAVTKEGKKDG